MLHYRLVYLYTYLLNDTQNNYYCHTLYKIIKEVFVLKHNIIGIFNRNNYTLKSFYAIYKKKFTFIIFVLNFMNCEF